MKRFISTLVSPAHRRVMCAGVSLACLVFSTSGAQPMPTAKRATVVAPVETQIPKSVFDADVTLGKDPFFPNSKRGLKKQESRSEPERQPVVAVALPAPEASSYLVLKGILGADGRRLALIYTSVKNYEFSRGESLTVKIPDHENQGQPKSIVIKCTEITDDSVTVEVSDGGKTENKALSFKK